MSDNDISTLTVMNSLISMARILKIDYKDFALAFNERKENQEYLKKLVEFQQSNDK